MHRSYRPGALFILCAAILAVIPACDRNDDPPPPIVVVTPEPVRGVIAQTSFSGFFTDVWVGIEVLVSDQGIVDITVDWTEDETWMTVNFGAQECDFVTLEAGSCAFMIESVGQTPKPRVLFSELLEPGVYYLYLYNVPRVPGTDIGSDVTEAVSIQLGLTVFPEGTTVSKNPIELGHPVRLGPPAI